MSETYQDWGDAVDEVDPTNCSDAEWNEAVEQWEREFEFVVLPSPGWLELIVPRIR